MPPINATPYSSFKKFLSKVLVVPEFYTQIVVLVFVFPKRTYLISSTALTLLLVSMLCQGIKLVSVLTVFWSNSRKY